MMRSRKILRAIIVAAGFAALGGCLFSEDPVLDASNGKATPLAPGPYMMCEIEDGEGDGKCNRFSVSYDATGLYQIAEEDDDPSEMRFRKVGRRGYAVQIQDDDSYMYYYGAGDTERFRLALMMCDDLPEATRAHLIADGDLETEDDDFSACEVKTLKGLTRAAKAYHRGKVTSEEEAVMEFTPAPPASDVTE